MPQADQPLRRRVDDAAYAALAAGFESLTRRIDAIERRDIEADIVHRNLEHSDGETASAVRDLAGAINHPKNGLIVELDRFRTDVANDRRVFKAWIAGAAAAISLVFAIITVYAPTIRDVLGIAQK